MKYFQIILIATLIITLSACQNSADKEKKKEPAKQDAYRIMTLTAQHLNENVQLPGSIEPFEFVQIYPKINGFVKDVYVDRGTKVRKGAILMLLDAPEQNERLAAAKLKYSEELAVLQNSMDRYNRLKETSNTPGTVSPYDLSAAHSKMLADEAMVQGELANYKAQQAMSAYLTVTAPFDGVITERNVHPGALVGPGAQNAKPMLVLQQQDKFRLVINLPEEYSSQINVGDEVHYEINALPGQDFTGHISRSSGALSDQYRSETVEVDVPNKDRSIKSGMHAEVTLPAKGNSSAFILPKTAVITTTEHKYIVAINDNKTQWVAVTTGNDNKDSTEVFGALKKGDNIITNATYEIKNGQHIGRKMAYK